jgi:hypothetical protein
MGGKYLRRSQRNGTEKRELHCTGSKYGSTAEIVYEILEFLISKQEETQPNVAVEWFAHLFRIREVPVSNLGQLTGYPERFFVFVLSTSRQMLG